MNEAILMLRPHGHYYIAIYVQVLARKQGNQSHYFLPGDPAKQTNLRSGVESNTFFTKFHTFKS